MLYHLITCKCLVLLEAVISVCGALFSCCTQSVLPLLLSSIPPSFSPSSPFFPISLPRSVLHVGDRAGLVQSSPCSSCICLSAQREMCVCVFHCFSLLGRESIQSIQITGLYNYVNSVYIAVFSSVSFGVI